MVFLSVAVVILTALVLIDLVLTGAVIRQLRDTEKQLVEMNTPPDTGMAPGELMPEFVSPDSDLSRTDLAGKRTLVAFFSTGCRHCPAQAERLAERADEIAGRGITVVSVLGVSEGDTEELSPLLRKAGRLITENGSGEVAGAFRAFSTPTLLVFGEDGVLVANGHSLDEVLGGR
ncbi:TlpA disulfide reductase family protein [Actinoplanes sp. NEAU-A12]|uniref:TlpA disulfide reductase family protein n=1 Tax=Actinoplanes sandaracinus TaxID=3045177 RepID=A0ABT6WCK4_9ACTN|nr:TlpA disulfide reductase family protein [Actinoplanes sandaracinus]MDI6097440.1 TlpA disulfide reductase family protein [Actinoplanes sandaracinus]